MEMLLYLFASIGILYLMRGAVCWLLYGRNKWGLYVEVPLSRYDRRSFYELLGRLRFLRESVVGKRLIKGIALKSMKNSVISREEAATMAQSFGLAVKKRRPRRNR